MPTRATRDPAAVLNFERSGQELRIRLSGPWTLAGGVPSPEAVADLLAVAPARRITFDTGALAAWDSGLLTFLLGVARLAAESGVDLDAQGLPESARRLLALATAVPARDVAAAAVDDATTARVGRGAIHAWATFGDALTFLGETTLALGSFLRGRARFRAIDLMLALESSGVAALGIVALINFLIGAVLAFVGAVQLDQFGASVYVADLVAIGMTRELGALMTGIVMAGRTGASYAAVLGTMTVNEEVDALQTMGLRPVEFLVVPRVLAMVLMMPVLVIYADLMGMLGGLFVGVAVLDLGVLEYLTRTEATLALRHVMVGLGKSLAFGAIVAVTGCYYGLRCGRSAAAVGDATTRAVVNAIVLLVVADAIITVLLHVVSL